MFPMSIGHAATLDETRARALRWYLEGDDHVDQWWWDQDLNSEKTLETKDKEACFLVDFFMHVLEIQTADLFML